MTAICCSTTWPPASTCWGSSRRPGRRRPHGTRASIPAQLFFGQEVAAGLVAEGRRADVIHANNVLAHVADTNGFVRGIAALLKDDGVAVIEVHYRA